MTTQWSKSDIKDLVVHVRNLRSTKTTVDWQELADLYGRSVKACRVIWSRNKENPAYAEAVSQ